MTAINVPPSQPTITRPNSGPTATMVIARGQKVAHFFVIPLRTVLRGAQDVAPGAFCGCLDSACARNGSDHGTGPSALPVPCTHAVDVRSVHHRNAVSLHVGSLVDRWCRSAGTRHHAAMHHVRAVPRLHHISRAHHGRGSRMGSRRSGGGCAGSGGRQRVQSRTTEVSFE